MAGEKEKKPGVKLGDDGPSGLGNPFGGSGVTVEHGFHREQLPLEGKTVQEVRQVLGPRFDIDPRAEATIGGKRATGKTVLKSGEILRFRHVAGEKGGAPSGKHGYTIEFFDGAKIKQWYCIAVDAEAALKKFKNSKIIHATVEEIRPKSVIMSKL